VTADVSRLCPGRSGCCD